MRASAAKLTVYFSERQRTGKAFLADALLDLYGRHGVHTSVLLRGADGFGAHHHLHTDRLLSSSESLPAVSIAVDTADRLEATLSEVELLAASRGRITLERAVLVSGEDLEQVSLPGDPDTAVKVTLYGGRGIRAEGQAGYVTAVRRLAETDASGASVLLAVDGTLHGGRRRARFFARNADVPLMLMTFGRNETMNRLLPALGRLLQDPVATVERVQLVKADGGRQLEAPIVAPADATGHPQWQKLTVHIEEGATHEGRPVHSELLLRLRDAGLAGVTVLRGVRGFYANRPPYADRALSLRRNAPVLLVAIDTPERVRGVWPIVDALTAEHGLITSELVPTSFTAR